MRVADGTDMRSGSAGLTAAQLALPPHLDTPLPETGRLDLPDGGWLRHARWHPQRAARGTVVMLNGRSEFIEKYHPIARAWTERGYEVLSMEWRGQGLSSRLTGEHKPSRQRGYIRDYRILIEDLRQFLAAVVRPAVSARGHERPVILFAHSMGGHVALRFLEERGSSGGPVLPFDAVVLSAPMTDIYNRPRWVSPRLARVAARLAVLAGLGRAYVPGQHDYDPEREHFLTNPLTTDPERWAIHHQWFRWNPDLVVGGVTFSWLDATFRSIDRLKRSRAGSTVREPMLVLVPILDHLVPSESQEALGGRYARCRVSRFPDSRHEILMEREDIRRRAWAEIDAFLDEVLAGRREKNIHHRGTENTENLSCQNTPSQ